MIDLSPAARAITRAVRDTMASRDWIASIGDDSLRNWLLTVAVCDALHQLGVGRVPSAKSLDDLLAAAHRNNRIGADFNGRNYRELARRHSISIRTVRRIVERQRKRGGG